MTLIPCIECGEEWHITWAREWETASHQYIGVPSDEFICLSCKVGAKR